MSTSRLLYFPFGQFGNYGSALTVKHDGVMPALTLENWAYGETTGNVTTHEGVTSKMLTQLGQELIKAAAKLEEIEAAAK